jgi:hypothetical protein
MTDAPRAQAGWYPDPTGRHEHRFWDGNAWTLDVADDGVAGIDARVRGTAAEQRGTTATTTSPEVPVVTDATRRRRPRRRVLLAAAVMAVAAAAGFLLSSSVFAGGDARDEYPAAVEANFVSSCRQSGGTNDACRCALDRIEDQYDLGAFTEASSEYDRTGVLPEKMSDAVLECLSEQTQQH